MNNYVQFAHLIEIVMKNDYSGCLDKKEVIYNHQLTGSSSAVCTREISINQSATQLYI